MQDISALAEAGTMLDAIQGGLYPNGVCMCMKGCAIHSGVQACC